MHNINEKESEQRNMVYYNQMLNSERKRKNSHRRKAKDFGSQQVVISDHIYIPQNYKAAAYTLYVVGIPYITGALFLFLTVAGGSFQNFKLMNVSAFPIVWLIGYEIVAAVMLIWILSLYLRYDEDE